MTTPSGKSLSPGSFMKRVLYKLIGRPHGGRELVRLSADAGKIEANDFKQEFHKEKYRFGLKEDHSLWAWGENKQGQLGDGTKIDRPTPVKILDGVKKFYPFNHFSFAILNDDSLWAWGQNYFGQLGDGTLCDRPSPIKIYDNVKKLIGGATTLLLLCNDDSLHWWSWNFDHNIKPGMEHKHRPSKILDDVSIAKSNGIFNAAAIKKDGTLWCSICEFVGGYRTLVGAYEMEQKLNDVKDVFFGNTCLYVLLNDDSLWGWGENEHGQLGDGTRIHRNIPLKILDDVKEFVSDKSGSSVALLKDGNLYMWGRTKSTDITLSPVLVDTDVQKIAKTDDGIYWKNRDGRLIHFTTSEK